MVCSLCSGAAKVVRYPHPEVPPPASRRSQSNGSPGTRRDGSSTRATAGARAARPQPYYQAPSSASRDMAIALTMNVYPPEPAQPAPLRASPTGDGPAPEFYAGNAAGVRVLGTQHESAATAMTFTEPAELEGRARASRAASPPRPSTGAMLTWGDDHVPYRRMRQGGSPYDRSRAPDPTAPVVEPPDVPQRAPPRRGTHGPFPSSFVGSSLAWADSDDAASGGGEADAARRGGGTAATRGRRHTTATVVTGAAPEADTAARPNGVRRAQSAAPSTQSGVTPGWWG